MSPMDFGGASGTSQFRQPEAQGPAPSGRDKAVRVQAPETSTPAAPVESAKAIAQTDVSQETVLGPTAKADEMLMLRSQSLSLARQEEMRLQEKLANLREMIEASETDLRQLQGELTEPGTSAEAQTDRRT